MTFARAHWQMVFQENTNKGGPQHAGPEEGGAATLAAPVVAIAAGLAAADIVRPIELSAGMFDASGPGPAR